MRRYSKKRFKKMNFGGWVCRFGGFNSFGSRKLFVISFSVDD
jgi:hypothetical protein